jgi:hypothetical protein
MVSTSTTGLVQPIDALRLAVKHRAVGHRLDGDAGRLVMVDAEGAWRRDQLLCDPRAGRACAVAWLARK